MSAFLGPIHHWLYNKIKLQENLTQAILSAVLSGDELLSMQKELTDCCGCIDISKPLEDIIDTGNIHAWLQDKVSKVESRYAMLIIKLLETDKASIQELGQIAFNVGKNNPINGETAKDVFKQLNDTMLNGMPCDRVNEIVSQYDEAVSWKHTRCIHSQYWENGDIGVYYKLRDSWILGMFADSDFIYTINDGMYSVERKSL